MPVLTDLLPPDVTAGTLELLDAVDVLRISQTLPTPLALPPGWEYQAHRPLREIEHLGFAIAGVPLRLWPTCPMMPDGLVRVHDTFALAVYEDIHGNLYARRYSQTPFHCWRNVGDDYPRASSVWINVNEIEVIRLSNMTRADRARLRAKREADPSNLYDYDAPYPTTC